MKKIALIGLPNCGKTALFNALTGSRQRVANFPGITVEKKSGEHKIGTEIVEVVDLPGLYSLDVNSIDERVTRDYILATSEDKKIDLFVVVLDASHIKKSLFLLLQLKELGIPYVVALNMYDEALKRGLELDLAKFSELFDQVPIVPTVAVKSEGIHQLDEQMQITFKSVQSTPANLPDGYRQKIKESPYIQEKLKLVQTIYQQIIIKEIRKDNFTKKVDSIVLHPVWGLVILLLTFLLLFQLLFIGADPFISLIEMGFEAMANFMATILPDGHFKSLVIDGIIAGVSGIIVFLPHIIFLFICIYFLEDFGYLGRVAFLLDFIMRKLGLPGKAVIPLLSSHACAIPGIMATRIIDDPKQRTITMLISPLMTCSARLPVYTLLIAAIVPDEKILGIFGLQGVMLFALYAFAIVMSFVVAFMSRKAISATSVSYLMMELPPYRLPVLKNILLNAWQKGVIFIKKAGTIIFFLSIVIWALVTFPNPPQDSSENAIEYSYAAKIGKTFEPLFRPLGFDWKISTALIPSFAAREVLVSAMATVMAVDQGEQVEEESMVNNLKSSLRSEYSVATLLALLIWFVFSPQCISTFAVLKKESNGHKIPLIFGFYTLALAYLFSWLTYNVALLIF